MQGYDQCFLCEMDKETNDHLWNCPKVLDILKPIFKKYYDKYKTLITSESDSTYALYSDAITRCPIFKWTKKPPINIKDNNDLHSLLMNYIPISITYPFKAAQINKKTTKTLLLKFIYELQKEIYEQIWKRRSIKWKNYKKEHDITKKSFIEYRKNFPKGTGERTRRTHNHGQTKLYRSPLYENVRSQDNNILWIYLTSSNFMHNLPWLSTLDNDLSEFTNNHFKNILLQI
jgi:hypothetical protein